MTMPAYYDNNTKRLTSEEFNDYKNRTTITEDPIEINNFLKEEFLSQDIEFEDIILLSNLIDNHSFLDKMTLVNDLSWRCCTLLFRSDGSIHCRAHNVEGTLSKVFKEWEEKGFERIFVMKLGTNYI